MFQSTPPAEARGDAVEIELPSVDASHVSIHSPRRSEGRRSINGASGSAGSFGFQSTPPAEARGDAALRANASMVGCFNPLPPPKRGETPRPFRRAAPGSSFNPLPRRSEGRLFSFSCLRARQGFNPLPPPKRGETLSPSRALRARQGFNPLPPPKRGETRVLAVHQTTQRVSIHSPAEARGDLPVLITGAPGIGFQSTPPAEARGDLAAADVEIWIS